MGLRIEELISRSDTEILKINHAPSTLMQYRWAWHRFAVFCSDNAITEFTHEVQTTYIDSVRTELENGQIKQWKYKLLRKTVLVLAEVQETGAYQWKVSRHRAANDVLNTVFRPFQEKFENWLKGQRIARDTQDLYAGVSRKTFSFWQQGHANLQSLTSADVASAVVFLGESYQPGSMRTVLSSLRVLCRFLEETQGCSSLRRSIPHIISRRTRHVSVLPSEEIRRLTESPDLDQVAGRRNRAMLLLGARLGLRPVDIVSLRLQNIQWHQGLISLVQKKTGTPLTLPLLDEVGEAIADYILHERPPDITDDHVFLRVQAPFVALHESSGLHYISSREFTRSGISAASGNGRGFRVLRASFATRMLENDTSLPVISGALGHRGIGSVKHYLSADEERLRECCLDFLGIEPHGSQA